MDSGKTQVAGFYSDLENSQEGECLKNLSGNWTGYHNYIDKVFSQKYSGYSSDQYACSYIRPMTTKRSLRQTEGSFLLPERRQLRAVIFHL